MKNLKSILTISMLASCSAIFAEEAKVATPEPIFVTLSNPKDCFEVSFSGLALQAFSNNCNYGAEALPFNYGDAQPAVSPSWTIPNISPKFHFGFDLGIAGMIHDAHSKLMLNWERFHSSSDHASFTVADSKDMFGPFFEIGPDASVYKKGKGSVYYHFDEVNLDYGTFLQMGSLLRMNLFAGASFMRVLEHRFSEFQDLAGSITRTLTVPAKFTGGGPQIGFDFNYKIVKGLEFVGLTRASLWVGSFSNKTTYTTASQDLIDLGDESPNIQTTTPHNVSGIVPGFEGKLGLAYEQFFCSNYMLKIEA